MRGQATAPVVGGGAWPDNEPTRPATRQHTRPHWCGGHRRDRRARLRHPRAVAGPGRGAGGWRQGQGGPRDRPLRAVRLACGDLAGGPPPTGVPSSPAQQRAYQAARPSNGRTKQPGAATPIPPAPGKQQGHTASRTTTGAQAHGLRPRSAPPRGALPRHALTASRPRS